MNEIIITNRVYTGLFRLVGGFFFIFSTGNYIKYAHAEWPIYLHVLFLILEVISFSFMISSYKVYLNKNQVKIVVGNYLWKRVNNYNGLNKIILSSEVLQTTGTGGTSTLSSHYLVYVATSSRQNIELTELRPDALKVQVDDFIQNLYRTTKLPFQVSESFITKYEAMYDRKFDLDWILSNA
ncbi:hypothetical protein HR060_06725 [Catenovulum sp. SM1970]|uniref:hypothetical protein n=1 Tax=Marinifaba aquimaris TaxID=2741323 RepID=UPI0015736434|nr:hypothetical protein [Marinifaba aquimaris]NTS76561.1 hypothetical protein [Marinifaba aquimaris]